MGSTETMPVQSCLSTAEDDEACQYAMQLASYAAFPMTLTAAIDLGALEVIAKAGRHLSPAEIIAELGVSNPDAPLMLDRILRLLASYKILTYRLETHLDGSVSRLYGPAPVCKYLTPNADGVSMAPMLMLIQNTRVIMEGWYHLKDAVIDGGVPFDKAHRVPFFEYLVKDPELKKSFCTAMSNHSTITMKKILSLYDGFQGLSTIVDVGGGTGATLHMIRSKYPEIKGVNFDLPQVIQDAPELAGVEHVSGNMFESIPNGDAIFLKWILHDWSDEACLKILKNCHKALPDHGKVIIAEGILPIEPESNVESKTTFHYDMVLLVHFHGGKERTTTEFQQLANATGFSRFMVPCNSNGLYLLEFTK